MKRRQRNDGAAACPRRRQQRRRRRGRGRTEEVAPVWWWRLDPGTRSPRDPGCITRTRCAWLGSSLVMPAITASAAAGMVAVRSRAALLFSFVFPFSVLRFFVSPPFICLRFSLPLTLFIVVFSPFLLHLPLFFSLFRLTAEKLPAFKGDWSYEESVFMFGFCPGGEGAAVGFRVGTRHRGCSTFQAAGRPRRAR